MSIKQKLFIVIGGLFGLSIILIISMALSSQLLVSQLHSFETLSLKIEKNKDMIIAHERFMSKMSKSLLNDTKYTNSSNHETCILGDWLYPFFKTEEYKNLPIEIQDKLKSLELSHKKIHKISSTFSKATTIDATLRNDIVHTAPKLFNDIILVT